jgi:uncharacterized protein YecA (UPF0149 family)
LEALSGVTISDLSESAREIVETELIQVNQITSGYDLETNDDYEAINDVDIAEALKRIETATNALIEFEVQRVMAGLREAMNKIPKVEIEEVRQHKDLFVPLLIEAIGLAVASAREGNKPEGEAHFFAAFLLTELEVDAAFPILLEGFMLSGEGAFDLFGDAVHELLPSALALFSQNGTDKIDEILRDTSIDMYVRWAASGAYIHLVRDGTITRDKAVAQLHERLVQCMAKEDYELIAPIICKLTDLAAEEALETIKAAFEQGLVDTGIVNLKSVESEIADGDETLQQTLKHCRPTGMPDTIADLSQWASFREEPYRPVKNPVPRNPVPRNPVPRNPVPRNPVPRPKSLRHDSAPSEPVTAIRSDRARVGRNAPCPCGSGKKFKKCCR